VKFKKSKHKLLLTLAKGIMLKAMRPAIQKVAEKQIKQNAAQLDALLYQVHAEAKRAEADAKRNPDPENVQNIYQRYVDAARKKMLEGKRKKDEVAADKKANVAVTQHDSIFPNIKLPGGISTKATEYKELARKGDKWESPIFGIGSAKETTNLPHVPSITRKPHHVTQGGVRGYNPDLRGEDQSRSAPNQFQQGPQSSAYQQPGAGYGQTGGGAFPQTSGAYGGQQNALNDPYKGINGSTNIVGNQQGTTLGPHNPVLTGSV